MLIPKQLFIHLERLEEWIEFDGLSIHDCSILYLYLNNGAQAPFKKEGRYEVHAVVWED